MERASTKANKDKRVLILEDDLCLQTFLCRIFHSIDPKIRIEWAKDLDEAFEKVSASEPNTTFNYDLILADILLPNFGNGLVFWDFCKRSSPETHFAFMSSQSPEAYLKLFKDQDPPAFLPKPFRMEDCKEVLGMLLNVRGNLQKPKSV
jgi:DNA-binding NtrC family response regulator